ncbi:uncharacterized protein LOC123676386 [Harmonia axyridis]|uniref:uncharacterized protein LOC123676386 n=1 Tax=Harmonia axyridis TaxID=115357 RepID=UPI001E276E99|nr:uncharacterized protein LOC123676386 [Harmonia axyridis]
MDNIERACNFYKFGWFIIMFINFMFGISGMTVCSLKLKYAENTEMRNGFFKISMIFASSNLMLSIFLLIAIIKNSNKYAFVYAFLSFVNLFTAVIYIESSTTANSTFITIFTVFASLWLLWFLIYGAYQFFINNTLDNDSATITPTGVSV